jgi:hypothetical protein
VSGIFVCVVCVYLLLLADADGGQALPLPHTTAHPHTTQKAIRQAGTQETTQCLIVIATHTLAKLAFPLVSLVIPSAAGHSSLFPLSCWLTLLSMSCEYISRCAVCVMCCVCHYRAQCQSSLGTRGSLGSRQYVCHATG